MRATAIIEAERPGIDTIIIWGDTDRLIAFGYENGRVTMTRPLTSADPNREALDAFQVASGELTTIIDPTSLPTRPVRTLPARWV
jgi:hypothetical protein